MFKDSFKRYGLVNWEELESKNFESNKLSVAAESLVSKLEALSEKVQLSELESTKEILGNFFKKEAGKIKWIEQRGSSFTFFSRPLQIFSLVKKLFAPYQGIQLVTDLPFNETLHYIVARLGLKDFKQETHNFPKDNETVINLFNSKNLSEEVRENLTKDHLPGAVLFSSLLGVKTFYNENYSYLKDLGNLFAQGYSGGSNKIFRNFTIARQSLVLASADYLIKNRFFKLPLKTLWLEDDPKSHEVNPYLLALANYQVQEFPHFYDLQRLLRFYLVLKGIKLLKGVEVNWFLNLEQGQLLALKQSLAEPEAFQVF